MHQRITASSVHFKIHLPINGFSFSGRLSKTESEEEKFQIHSFTEVKLDNEAAASKSSAGTEFCPLVGLHAHHLSKHRTKENTPLLDVDTSLIFLDW